MAARTVMVQGTGSSVGKSIMVAALCRIMRQDGLRVAPFKSQNMALNSFVTRDGCEMGRAQVVQAEAAGLDPSVDMNPVLIKPEADAKSQVVVMGRPWKTVSARDYYTYTPELLPKVRESLDRLRSRYDVVVIEGAGSPAEINLQRFEIVNMKIAELADAPVLLVGDIDKGGVFASLVGTVVLLDEAERARIKGFIINKFRGDVSILQPGLERLERETGIPVLGVVPYFHDIVINEEDSVRREEAKDTGSESLIDVAVIHFPRISNSTDFEPLQQEPGVRVRYITAAWQLGHPDLIILPGSKSTISDLVHIKETGLAEAIVRRAKGGTPVIGICGGFQMLGSQILDPERVESDQGGISGLGLLDITTVFEGHKTTHQVRARVCADVGLLEGLSGTVIEGYEIHMGQTGSDESNAVFEIIERSADTASHADGAVTSDGSVLGTYLHGLFDSEELRRGLLRNIGWGVSPDMAGVRPPSPDEQYDRLADLVRETVDMARIYEICGIDATAAL